MYHLKPVDTSDLSLPKESFVLMERKRMTMLLRMGSIINA